MAAKRELIEIKTPKGVGAFLHLYKPDDEAPEGATWKPDGKFKATILFDEEPTKLIGELKAAAKKFFPDLSVDDVQLPLTQVPEDHKKEDLRGKWRLTAKTNRCPAGNADASVRNSIVDGAGRVIQITWVDGEPRGTLVRSGDIIKLRLLANPYTKEEKVRERVNGKMVEKTETVHGVATWLAGVMLVEKRNSGGTGWGDEDLEEAPEDTGGWHEAPAREAAPDTGVDNDGDF